MTTAVRIFASPLPGGFKPGRFSELFARIFAGASEKPIALEPGDFPPALADYIRLVRGDLRAYEPAIPTLAPPGNPRTLVAFSGGKDSAAVALLLREQELAPIPVFVKGINRSYPGELDAASAVARALGLLPPLIIDVSQSGSSPYLENPTKNHLILAILADFAESRGIGGIAFGSAAADSAAWMNPEAGLSDCVELFDALEPYYRAEAPGLTLHYRMLADESQSYEDLLRLAGPRIFDHIRSCMMPARYVPQHRRRVSAAFRTVLRPGRCGTCYKCANEALHLHALGAEPLPAELRRHYVKALRRASATVSRAPAASDLAALELFLARDRYDLERLAA